MPLTAVIFDWDGTLFDSAAASLRSFQKMFHEFGITLTPERHDELYAPDWYGMYRALDLPREVWAHADQRWLDHYRNEQCGLVTGARPVLEGLRAGGRALGIVSSGTRHRIERELARLNLKDMFGALVCNEDVAARKPHPEGLQLAMSRLGRSPQSCCFVGDTPEDIRMGQAAGVMTIGVPGYVSAARLAECGPDGLIGCLAELPEALDRCAGGE